MVLFKNLLCVLVTYMTESWVSPCCSYEFNVVSMQREKHSVFIPQQRMKYTLAKTTVKENHYLEAFFLFIIFSFTSVYT